MTIRQEESMEKQLDLDLDRENKKTRELGKFISGFIVFVAVAMSLFHLYTGAFGVFTAMIQRGMHLFFVLGLIFLLYPFGKNSGKKLPYYDVLLSILGFTVGAYIVINYGDIVAREGMPTSAEIILGIIATLLVLEAARRTMGMAMVIIAGIFLLYAYLGPYIPGDLGHRGYSIERISYQMYLTTSGIFSIPFGTSATIITLFILFGVFLDKSGAGKYFMDIAIGLTGRTRGGPAKASVFSSALMGTVSGSAVANVVTTGAFTIPLMKRTGYKPHFAGAVEAVASTGGQFMPPVMGAVAFIMAELTEISYLKICIAAALPALLYYLSLFMMVHFEAVKTGLQGIPRDQLPDVKKSFLKGFHLFVPIIFLVVLLVKGYSPMYAAFRSIILLIIMSMLTKANRMSLRDIISALETGAKSVLGVAAACATAGIVIGVITLTGLGVKLSSILIDLSGGNLLILLVLTMLASIILGMGLPTAACYVLLAALVAPALVDSGVSVIGAHLFILYFGCISAITPPVALAAYAGAGVAGADPNKVGVTACRIGIVAFIIPYMFIYGPGLLMEGSAVDIARVVFTSSVGCVVLAAGIQGQFIRRCNWAERMVLLAAALTLIDTGTMTDIAGLSMVGVIGAIQIISARKAGFYPQNAEGKTVEQK